MGNILAPPAAPQVPLPPPLVLEEEGDGRGMLLRHLGRLQASNPLVMRILGRVGPAAAMCAALTNSTGGAVVLSVRDGFSALHLACAVGWMELVQQLLEVGAQGLDAPSLQGYTPLMLAAMCGHAPVVRLLLERGARLDVRSRRGATVIGFASQASGNLEVLQALLAHPVCTPELVRQLGYRQRSALLLALLHHGSPTAVRALLGAGADPSEKCAPMAGVSLLHTCAHLSRVDAMRELLAAGARVDVAGEDGITAVHECFVQPPNRQRSEAAKRQMFGMLVAAGADVNRRVPSRGYTVLHFVMASCREEATADMLLDSGLDLSAAVNTLVGQGEEEARVTVLHLACMKGWTRLADRLVEAGASMTLRNKDGFQPLHSAVLGGHSGTVAALLRQGADPLATCPDCYPSFPAWKVRRGLQALQAIMHAEEGVLPAALAQVFGGPDGNGAARLTAVDLACCVARHIPTVEAFVDHGVLPSPAALALAEHAVPMMRAVVERPLLTPQLAKQLPSRFRAAAREALLCLSRPATSRDGRRVYLSSDAIAAVLQKAAFPVSAWADPAWLARQHVRSPPERAPAAQAPAQAPAQQGPGELAPGVHILGPGEQPPPFLQAVVDQMQQQMGGPVGHVIIMHQPMAGGLPMPGGPQPGVGVGIGVGVGAGGAAGGAEAPAVPAAGAGGAGPAGAAAGAAAGAEDQDFGFQFQFQLPAGMPGMPGLMVPPLAGPGMAGLMGMMHGMLAGLAQGLADDDDGDPFMFGFEEDLEEEEMEEEDAEAGLLDSDDDAAAGVPPQEGEANQPAAQPTLSPQLQHAPVSNNPAGPQGAVPAAACSGDSSAAAGAGADRAEQAGPSSAARAPAPAGGSKRPSSPSGSSHPHYQLRDRSKRQRRE